MRRKKSHYFGQSIAKKLKTTTTRDRHLMWNNHYTNKNFGIWIECTMCKKWRKNFDYAESHQVPEKWDCSMSTSEAGVKGSCDDPEEDWSEEHLNYCPGSIVWAKLDGYPWWPAMVDEDPDVEEFYWKENGITSYNVTFLDENNVSRAWIRENFMMSFLNPPPWRNSIRQWKHKQTEYTNGIRKAEEVAKLALEMTIEERLQKYSFAHLYKGKWPRAHDYEEKDDGDITDILLKEIDDLDSIHSFEIDGTDSGVDEDDEIICLSETNSLSSNHSSNVEVQEIIGNSLLVDSNENASANSKLMNIKKLSKKKSDIFASTEVGSSLDGNKSVKPVKKTKPVSSIDKLSENGGPPLSEIIDAAKSTHSIIRNSKEGSEANVPKIVVPDCIVDIPCTPVVKPVDGEEHSSVKSNVDETSKKKLITKQKKMHKKTPKGKDTVLPKTDIGNHEVNFTNFMNETNVPKIVVPDCTVDIPCTPIVKPVDGEEHSSVKSDVNETSKKKLITKQKKVHKKTPKSEDTVLPKTDIESHEVNFTNFMNDTYSSNDNKITGPFSEMEGKKIKKKNLGLKLKRSDTNSPSKMSCSSDDNKKKKTGLKQQTAVNLSSEIHTSDDKVEKKKLGLKLKNVNKSLSKIPNSGSGKKCEMKLTKSTPEIDKKACKEKRNKTMSSNVNSNSDEADSVPRSEVISVDLCDEQILPTVVKENANLSSKPKSVFKTFKKPSKSNEDISIDTKQKPVFKTFKKPLKGNKDISMDILEDVKINTSSITEINAVSNKPFVHKPKSTSDSFEIFKESDEEEHTSIIKAGINILNQNEYKNDAKIPGTEKEGSEEVSERSKTDSNTKRSYATPSGSDDDFFCLSLSEDEKD